MVQCACLRWPIPSQTATRTDTLNSSATDSPPPIGCLPDARRRSMQQSRAQRQDSWGCSPTMHHSHPGPPNPVCLCSQPLPPPAPPQKPSDAVQPSASDCSQPERGKSTPIALNNKSHQYLAVWMHDSGCSGNKYSDNNKHVSTRQGHNH